MSGDLNSAAVLVTRLLRAERLIAAHHQGASVEAHGTECAVCAADKYFLDEAPVHWRPVSVQKGG